MTETISSEKAVISVGATPSSEKIAERKTIVYETRVDPTVIKVAGEKLKGQLFTRFGIFKPRPGEVQLLSVDKYYEPHAVISGKYAIDYFRKCAYTVKVDKKVLEVSILNHKFEPKPPSDPYAVYHNMIRLEGEERLVKEVKATLIVDKSGRDVSLERIPCAPSERNPIEVLTEFGAEEIADKTDLEFIRSRVVKRPKDVNRVVTEQLEVNERVVIYAPRFRVSYRNIKTGKEKTAEFDGVTAKRIS